MQPDYQPGTDSGVQGTKKITPRFRKLFKPPQPFLQNDLAWENQSTKHLATSNLAVDIADQPTRLVPAVSLAELQQRIPYEQMDEQLEADFDTNRMSGVRLMQLSGIIQAVKLSPAGSQTPELAEAISSAVREQLSGSIPSVSAETARAAKSASGLKAFLGKPVVKIGLGLLVGIIFLLLVSRVVDVPKTIGVLKMHLTTKRGVLYAILTILSFLAAFSIRGARWKMFLRPITNVSVFKAIRIYWVGVFTNVLLPVQGGEVAKSLMLKRVAGVPVSQSLPTVAMDKALDLMPALIIISIVAFIPGVHMTITLWLILGLVSSILLGVIFVVGLMAWNRRVATALIKKVIGFLPKGLGGKIEGFAMGFVDSLLAGARRPKTFIPAVLLTCLAVSCDGLFAMFAFWTVGVTNINFGMAIFGYTVFNMFCILPNPPGQVGSNELYGTLVFSQLLGFDKEGVLAMFFFSHPLTALIMATTAGLCLSSLGLKISSALKAPPHEHQPATASGSNQAAERQAVTA